MIIVTTTTNETAFIDEKKYHTVEYLKEDKLVRCWDGERYSTTIVNVEFVYYSNDAIPCDFKVESSEIQKLKEELEKEQTKTSWAWFRFEELRVVYREINNYFDSVHETKDVSDIEEFYKRIDEMKEESLKRIEKYKKEHNI